MKRRLEPNECQQEECNAPLSLVDNFYCHGCWDDLIHHLCDQVERIAERARRLYIGRTYSPALRAMQHYARGERNALTILYWSENRREVMSIEETLIRAYLHAHRLENESFESDGQWAREAEWNCVYLSWEPKAELSVEQSGIRSQRVSDLAANVKKKHSMKFLPDAYSIHIDPLVTVEAANRMLKERISGGPSSRPSPSRR